MKVPIDLSAIKYDFMIIRQGVIYIGPFEKNIIIKNVSFCMDDNLSRVNTLAFVIIDIQISKCINGIIKNRIIYIKKTNAMSRLRRMVNFLLNS